MFSFIFSMFITSVLCSAIARGVMSCAVHFENVLKIFFISV